MIGVVKKSKKGSSKGRAGSYMSNRAAHTGERVRLSRGDMGKGKRIEMGKNRPLEHKIWLQNAQTVMCPNFFGGAPRD